MKLEEVIEKRISAYYRLCDNFIMYITFNDDDGYLQITTTLAQKATTEHDEEDIFNFGNEKYANLWYEGISLEEWYNKESDITYPQKNWMNF